MVLALVVVVVGWGWGHEGISVCQGESVATRHLRPLICVDFMPLGHRMGVGGGWLKAGRVG